MFSLSIDLEDAIYPENTIEQILALPSISALFPAQTQVFTGKYKDLIIDKYNHKDIDIEDMEKHMKLIDYNHPSDFNLSELIEMRPLLISDLGYISVYFTLRHNIVLNITISIKDRLRLNQDRVFLYSLENSFTLEIIIKIIK